MPKFDDRFARQNRCEPPPEFPLASPYSGIVHHLSGPNSHALTQIHPKTSGSVDGAPRRVPTSVHFHCASRGFDDPNARVDVRLLGPCFKTGRLRPLRQRPCPPEGGRGTPSVPAGRIACRSVSSPPVREGPRFRHLSTAARNRRWPVRGRMNPSSEEGRAERPRASLPASASLSTISRAV